VPQGLYGNFGEEKNLLPLTGYETPTVQPISLVTILTADKGASTMYFCVLCSHKYLFVSFDPNFVNMNPQNFLGRPIFLSK
jgi:hypothetical protein